MVARFGVKDEKSRGSKVVSLKCHLSGTEIVTGRKLTLALFYGWLDSTLTKQMRFLIGTIQD